MLNESKDISLETRLGKACSKIGDIALTVGYGIASLTLNALGKVAYWVVWPYAPTTINRKIDKEGSADLSYGLFGRPATEAGAGFDAVIASGTLGTQAYFYCNNPKYLAIPIATNVISAVYEITKRHREKKKNKFSEHN